MNWLKKLYDPCNPDAKVGEYLDGKLDKEQTQKLEKHAVACEVCRELLLLSAEGLDETEIPSYALINKAMFTALEKNNNLLHLVVKAASDTLEILSTNGQLIPATAAVVRGKAMTAPSSIFFKKSFGLYEMQTRLDAGKDGLLDLAVSLRGPEDNGQVKDYLFSLEEGGRELLSVHAEKGSAVFDSLTPGSYRIEVRERGDKIGSLMLELQD